jgi:hypothetical protein
VVKAMLVCLTIMPTEIFFPMAWQSCVHDVDSKRWVVCLLFAMKCPGILLYFGICCVAFAYQE